MKNTVLLLVFCLCVAARAQRDPPLDLGLEISTIPLYPPSSSVASDASPGSVPTLTLFRPQHPNGGAVIIAPGGGYLALASNLEGAQVAEWFAARGFSAFVLRYRLGAKNPYPIPLEDALRAVRLVRSLAKTYALADDRVGFVGFSAGGHLAAAAATLFDALPAPSSDPVDHLSARPDFVVLGYPWLNAMEPAQKNEITYCSVLQLFTAVQCAAFDKAYTPKLHVTSTTPTTFIFSTTDDATVPVRASVDYYQAMQAAGAPIEMHLFRHGAHGSGLGSGDAALDLWPVLLEAWLRDIGLMTHSTRKAGDPLTLDSPVGDLIADPAAAAAIGQIAGPTFLPSLPKEAMVASLRVLAGYFPKQLSKANIDKMDTALRTLPPR